MRYFKVDSDTYGKFLIYIINGNDISYYNSITKKVKKSTYTNVHKLLHMFNNDVKQHLKFKEISEVEYFNEVL